MRGESRQGGYTVYWSIADLYNSRAASCRIAMDPHQHTAVEARPSPWRWLVPQRKPRKQLRTHSLSCTPRIHVACDMSPGISSTLPEHVYVATPVRASPRLSAVGKRVRKSREASGGMGVRHGDRVLDSSRFLDIYPARYVTFLNKHVPTAPDPPAWMIQSVAPIFERLARERTRRYGLAMSPGHNRNHQLAQWARGRRRGPRSAVRRTSWRSS
jgi:hypothetical protein